MQTRRIRTVPSGWMLRTCCMAAGAMIWVTTLSACRAVPERGGIPTQLRGQTFQFTVACDPHAHAAGLGGRSTLAIDEGMIFVFDELAYQSFVMRDCAMPLDLVFIDDEGVVISIHHMVPEPPRTHAESQSIEAQDAAYMARLRSYISPRPCRCAVELPGGTAARIGLQSGMRTSLDARAAARLCKRTEP